MHQHVFVRRDGKIGDIEGIAILVLELELYDGLLVDKVGSAAGGDASISANVFETGHVHIGHGIVIVGGDIFQRALLPLVAHGALLGELEPEQVALGDIEAMDGAAERGRCAIALRLERIGCPTAAPWCLCAGGAISGCDIRHVDVFRRRPRSVECFVAE